MSGTKPLVKLLCDLGLIRALPDESVFTTRPECPIKVLSRLKLLDEVDAIEKVAKKLAIPFLDLDSPETCATFKFDGFKEKIENDFCWKHKVLPLYKADDHIVIACADPLDTEAVKTVEFVFASRAKVAIAEEAKIVRHLSEHFPPQKINIDGAQASDSLDTVEILSPQAKRTSVEDNELEAAPTIKITNKILGDAVRESASDIHIEPAPHGLDVRFRIDGVMQSMFEIPKRTQLAVTSRIKLLAGMDISERRRPQDGRLRVRVGAEAVDMRVSTVPAAYGEKIVLRLLRSNASELSFTSLGFPKTIETALLRALNGYGKLLLVTGPTGSGKTTTLYTCVNYLKDGTTNIETVEDPIENKIVGVNQIQVNDAIGVTFASALRSILRQDPDVIMVGEIRDSETTEIALQAAHTGHLVISTLHTNNAPSAITRLLNLGAEPFVLASCLGGILAQRLLRKVCPKCIEPIPAGDTARYEDLIDAYNLDPATLIHGKGCEKCNFTGYRGRVGAFSYLEITEAISDLIEAKSPLGAIVTEAKKNGYIDLSDSCIELARQGVTSLEEVRPYVQITSKISKEAAAPVPSPARDERAPSQTERQTSGRIEKQKVVLVEDDENMRMILSMLLEHELFDVVQAKNGKEGLDLVYSTNPDVVLCDLMMPIMDGKEFLKKMQAHKSTREIPVIILTAVDTEENEAGLIDLGAKDFVSKQSAPQVLLSRIRRAIAAAS